MTDFVDQCDTKEIAFSASASTTVRREGRRSGEGIAPVNNPWQIPDAPSPMAVLRVDLEEARIATAEELTNLVLELDRRMRESGHTAFLDRASTQQRATLSDLSLTNTRIAS